MRDKEVNSGLTLWFKQGTRPMSLQSLQHVCLELYYYYYYHYHQYSSCSKSSIHKIIIIIKNADKFTH